VAPQALAGRQALQVLVLLQMLFGWVALFYGQRAQMKRAFFCP
jgi:hypothetical protein